MTTKRGSDLGVIYLRYSPKSGQSSCKPSLEDDLHESDYR